MSIETTGIDPDFIAAYEEAEFRQQYKAAVAAALGRIDRARSKLIEAQNELTETLAGSNDYTRSMFTGFYAAGGVTARDWAQHSRAQLISPPRAVGRGQLRLIPASH